MTKSTQALMKATINKLADIAVDKKLTTEDLVGYKTLREMFLDDGSLAPFMRAIYQFEHDVIVAMIALRNAKLRDIK